MRSTLQMLHAVQTVHDQRIVHSDLKPANFLLVEGTLKLIDFGIASAIQNDATSVMRESQVGVVLATQSQRAPRGNTRLTRYLVARSPRSLAAGGNGQLHVARSINRHRRSGQRW